METINDEYVKNALFQSAQYLKEVGLLLQPFNNMYALSFFKQAELMVEHLETFNESINTIKEPVVPKEISEEIDELVKSLKGSLGEL